MQMMLQGYQALDLTDEKGFLCGKILGDLGVDVIKVEKPGGDLAGRKGPYYKDILDSNKSLYWYAFNTSKRGITLNIETADGQALFRRLVKNADFIINSSAPGYLEALGLGYSQLSYVNPRIIMVSITPFGLSELYRDYKAQDIIISAMSGLLYLTGDPDRPPLWSGFPHAYAFAAIDGVVGALTALYHRHRTGEGQQVYISAQSTHYPTTYFAVPTWMTQRVICHREGRLRRRPEHDVTYNIHWQCKDGYVTFYYHTVRGLARSNKAMVEWIDREGISCDFLKSIDWENFDMGRLTQKEVDQMQKPSQELFMRHTKQELYSEAIKRRVVLFPMNTTKDIAESAQLADRGYWVEIEHPELGTTVRYAGPFVKASESRIRIWRRAPLIGEHNEEIYGGELGLSKDELVKLKQCGII